MFLRCGLPMLVRVQADEDDVRRSAGALYREGALRKREARRICRGEPRTKSQGQDDDGIIWELELLHQLYRRAGQSRAAQSVGSDRIDGSAFEERGTAEV